MRLIIAIALAVLGAALLAVSLAGLTMDYEVPPGATPRAASANPDSRPLTRLRGEDEMDYLRRLTTGVHERMTHWGSLQHGGQDPVAVWDNWILATAGVVRQRWRNWEFWEHERALARGWGLCTQHATIVFDVLEDQGYSPRRIDWPAHSVVEVDSRDDGAVILDADMNVVLEHSHEEIAARPVLARPAYARVNAHENGLAGKSPEGMADWAEAFWRQPPQWVHSVQRYPRERQMESIAYLLKWPLPALLLAAGVWLLRRPRSSELMT